MRYSQTNRAATYSNTIYSNNTVSSFAYCNLDFESIIGYFQSVIGDTVNSNLIQKSQVVKKECSPQKGYGEKRCEIQGGSQEMAVMVGLW